MKYILLEENTVKEIIPGEDPVFPGIPIDQRFPADFVDQLIPTDDETEVDQHWVYDEETGTFSPPPPYEPEPTPEPEPGPIQTAEKDYEVGEYLTIDGVLFRVVLPILAGSQITVGTNVEATTIETELTNLNREE